MKKKLMVSALLITGAFIYSYGRGVEVGKIHKVDKGKREVHVSTKNGQRLNIGDHLQVATDSGKVVLEVTFPMLTFSKCKIKGKGRFSSLSKGMKVYRYSKDEIAVYKIGDRGPAGGWIFYDKGNYNEGWRYLEAAPEDQSSEVQWGCESAMPGAKGMAIGSGKNNTRLIVKSCQETESAAKLCMAYPGGGKRDWFLPSIDELNLIYKNLYKANIGGFADTAYWSSSANLYFAWLQDFVHDGFKGEFIKSSPAAVRAVRAF